MTGQVHSVMKDSDNLNQFGVRDAVHDDMPPPTTMAGNVQRPDSRPQIVTGNASENFRAGVEISESGKDCRFVNGGLTRAENIAGIAEDTDEIFLRLGTKDYAPRFCSHAGFGAAVRAFAPTVSR